MKNGESVPPAPVPEGTRPLPFWQIPGERPGEARRHDNWYRHGSWELERMRCRIAYGRPPAPWREPTTAGDIVRNVAERLGLGDNIALDGLQKDWESIVGVDVARHCRPVALERGVLAIAVDGSLWMFTLRRSERMLLDSVRGSAAGKDVTRIAFRPGTGAAARAPRP